MAFYYIDLAPIIHDLGRTYNTTTLTDIMSATEVVEALASYNPYAPGHNMTWDVFGEELHKMSAEEEEALDLDSIELLLETTAEYIDRYIAAVTGISDIESYHMRTSWPKPHLLLLELSL